MLHLDKLRYRVVIVAQRLLNLKSEVFGKWLRIRWPLIGLYFCYVTTQEHSLERVLDQVLNTAYIYDLGKSMLECPAGIRSASMHMYIYTIYGNIYEIDSRV